MTLSVKKILSYVIVVHVVLGLSLFADWRTHSVKKPNHLIVKTVRLSPIASQKKEPAPISPEVAHPEVAHEDKPQIEESPPKMASKPPPDLPPKPKEPPPKVSQSKPAKKNSPSTPKKKEVQKAVAMQPKEVTKPKIDEKKKKLLQEAKDKIAKMSTAKMDIVNTSEKREKTLLSKIKGAHVPVVNSESGAETQEAQEAKYIEKLSALLQGSLRLPESGDVCLNIKLDRAGKVINWGVVSSMSEKNEAYVNIHLPKLRFPPFQSEWPGEKQHTFFLTLSDLK